MSLVTENQKLNFSIINFYRTNDGGASQKVSDLWCTYAGTRALTWLGEAPLNKQGVTEYILECQNSDGGFAWQKGMRSDVWATYYCTQTLTDLGYEVPNLSQLAAWMQTLAIPDGGFSMTSGQPADIWATYYATRVFCEVLKQKPSTVNKIQSWLAATQQPSGGLGWNTSEHPPDVRACYYGAVAWKCLEADWRKGNGWNHRTLVKWLQEQQRPEGGFVFNPAQKEPGLWATFRAVKALEALDSEPRDKVKCIEWILSRQIPEASFTRWSTYDIADVWASFSAAGALNSLGTPLKGQAKEQTVRFLQSCQLPGAGFTYREPENAGDSLATSALCILGIMTDRKKNAKKKEAQAARVAWLRRAHMPYEGGVMYMPGRGAEVRCTLWAIAALSFAKERLLDRNRLYQWFSELQNPDGGFGYWHGRGSDLVATVSAIETLQYLGLNGEHKVDFSKVEHFLLQCESETGMKFSPYGEDALSTTCQGIRALLIVGMEEKARSLATLIPKHVSRLGGYAAKTGGLPDLISTYQSILTLQTLEQDWDTSSLERFLSKVQQPEGGYAWSPLSRKQAGPLAACLGELLHQALLAKQFGKIFSLPKLNL
jgi:prenyltransferase beta subunit